MCAIKHATRMGSDFMDGYIASADENIDLILVFVVK